MLLMFKIWNLWTIKPFLFTDMLLRIWSFLLVQCVFLQTLLDYDITCSRVSSNFHAFEKLFLVLIWTSTLWLAGCSFTGFGIWLRIQLFETENKFFISSTTTAITTTTTTTTTAASATRLDGGWWNQYLNFWPNLVFLMSADSTLWRWRQLQRRQRWRRRRQLVSRLYKGCSIQ